MVGKIVNLCKKLESKLKHARLTLIFLTFCIEKFSFEVKKKKILQKCKE